MRNLCISIGYKPENVLKRCVKKYIWQLVRVEDTVRIYTNQLGDRDVK